MFQELDRTAGIRLLNKDLLHSFYSWLTIEQLAQLLLDKEQAPFVLNALFKRRNKNGLPLQINDFFKHILNYSDEDFQIALRGIADTHPVFNEGLYAGMAWLKKTKKPFPFSKDTFTSLFELTRYKDLAIDILKLFLQHKIPISIKKEQLHDLLNMTFQKIFPARITSLTDNSLKKHSGFLDFCQDYLILTDADRQELLSKLKQKDILAFLGNFSLYSLYLKLCSPPGNR